MNAIGSAYFILNTQYHSIPLPVFLILLLFIAMAWYCNRFLQKIIKPRESLGRLFLYLLSGFAFVFVAVYMAVRIILWLFPPR